MTMKFSQLAVGAAFMLSPVLAISDGDPEALAIEELDRVNSELAQVRAEIIRLKEELERANENLDNTNAAIADAETNANSSAGNNAGSSSGSSVDTTVASTSLSRDGTPLSNGGEFYASDEALQFTYERFGALPVFDNTRTTGSFIFSESRDVALIGGIFYDFTPDFLFGVDLSFGVKAYATLLGIEDEDAIAIGGAIEGRYRLPVETIPLPYIEHFPLTASAGLGVAPDILSFGDSDRVIDWFARIGIEASEDIDVFFGFRFLQVNTQPGDTEIDDRFHLGVKWKL